MVSGTLDRATRLVTPGGEVEDAGLKPGAATALRKVPQRIDRRRSEARWHRTGKPVRRLRIEDGLKPASTCSRRLARVKRWGKSPPLRWRHRGHGKPRVVQGQIGGESRPGSMSERS